MIKDNGYYLTAPNPYIDYVAGDNIRTGIFHSAYMFQENGIVKFGSKETKDGTVAFRKEDFENSLTGTYVLRKDFLELVFDENKKWEVRIIFKINGDQLENVKSNSGGGIGQIYQFQKW